MDVYLVQHGEAVSAEQDAQRPLSEAGRAATTKVARYLAARGRRLLDPPVAGIWHSGKLRARQTAEILAQVLGGRIPLTARDGLNPKDDPRVIGDELAAGRDRSQAIVLVGHLPHLAYLTGLLLADDVDKTLVRFVNSGVLRISATEAGWAVQWYLTPACVG